MRTVNLPRAGGKTTRAVIASEMYQYPILAVTRAQAKIIKDRARELNAIIPEPILVEELPQCKSGVIIDEGIHTLLTLIRNKAEFPIDVPLITLTVPNTNINDLTENMIQDLIGVQEMIQELPDCEIGKFKERCDFIAKRVKNNINDIRRMGTI